MKLSDIHSHFPEKSTADICIGSALADSLFSAENLERQASFSLQHNIPFTFGIHPWQAAYMENNFEYNLAQLEALFIKYKDKSILMGEIGLDSCKPNLPLQKVVFERQLDIATGIGCPAIVLHCVRTLHLLPPILERFRKKSAADIIIHGFCGSIQEVEKLSRCDVYFSVSEKLLKHRKKAVYSAAVIPENRLLTETDMDSPETLHNTLLLLSSIRNQKPDDCATQIFDNAKRIISHLKNNLIPLSVGRKL